MNIVKKKLFVLVTLILMALCKAQAEQIIVQLNDDTNFGQLKTSPEITSITLQKQLSKNLNIWLIEALSTSKNETTLLNLKKHSHIKTAQYNEAVELRNTPNDEHFDQQWQYFNTGENQGRTDADIDALKAWDIITGGTTTRGDEIVVAVIDGGVDLKHLDLINNLSFGSKYRIGTPTETCCHLE